MRPQDGPLMAIVAEVEKHAAAGRLCFQKFTCAGCGQRLTIEEPNRFYTEGTCDRCGALTNIVERGCGYVLIQALTPGGEEVLQEAGRGLS